MCKLPAHVCNSESVMINNNNNNYYYKTLLQNIYTTKHYCNYKPLTQHQFRNNPNEKGLIKTSNNG